VVTPDQAHGLLSRHVLWPDEAVQQVRPLRGAIDVDTQLRRFVVDSQRDQWHVGRAGFVADVVVATRRDLVVHGWPERFVILLLDTGDEVHANDPEALAALGARVPDPLDPVAFADLLVQLHPYSHATRTVLVHRDDLRRGHGRADLPEIAPLRVDRSEDGVLLTFTSSIEYRTSLDGALLDLAEWTVTIATGGPAEWEAKLVHERIALDPAVRTA